MQDRVSLYPGRVKLVPVAGQENTYDMVRADSPTQEGTPLNKSTLLQDATCAILDIPSSSVPNDAFVKLALGIGKYGYVVHVRYADGRPAEGYTLIGLNAPDGSSAVTDANGDAVVVSTSQLVTISVSSPYLDISDVSDVVIESTGILTEHTITLSYVTDYVTIRSSRTLNFSSLVQSIDFTAVGGGGGGAYPSGPYSGEGPGGGGGYVVTQLGVAVTSSDTISVVIGGGGAAKTNLANGTAQEGRFTAGTGGTTSVIKNSSTLFSATGGGGATGWYRNGSASVGIGNGNGGATQEQGKSGSGYIFNDSSLGRAGGGGGGGAGSGYLTSANYSGLPYGALGSYKIGSGNNGNAGAAGIGGGGGGGRNGNGWGGAGSNGGAGAVYVRFHH